MKKYYCDMCGKELLVKSWQLSFKLIQKYVGSDLATGNLEIPTIINKEICAECADKVREMAKGL